MKRGSIGTTRQCARKLVAANRRLKQEIALRLIAEESLKTSERHYTQLLEQSRQMQERLRHLSHHVLLAQEEERKLISRELHDEIAQTLAGINVYLAALKAETTEKTRGLGRKIARTQRLVEKSVSIVHRFARELRPTVLDDLGLIPALHSFIKAFTKRTNIPIRITASGAVEQLDSTQRTVLFRVAQEALTNIDKHSAATFVNVSLRKMPGAIHMEIHDNGRSFQVERMLFAKRNKRLGLVGMRERTEMVGGNLYIESAPATGTTIRAEIPLANGTRT